MCIIRCHLVTVVKLFRLLLNIFWILSDICLIKWKTWQFSLFKTCSLLPSTCPASFAQHICFSGYRVYDPIRSFFRLILLCATKQPVLRENETWRRDAKDVGIVKRKKAHKAAIYNVLLIAISAQTLSPLLLFSRDSFCLSTLFCLLVTTALSLCLCFRRRVALCGFLLRPSNTYTCDFTTHIQQRPNRVDAT